MARAVAGELAAILQRWRAVSETADEDSFTAVEQNVRQVELRLFAAKTYERSRRRSLDKLTPGAEALTFATDPAVFLREAIDAANDLEQPVARAEHGAPRADAE